MQNKKYLRSRLESGRRDGSSCTKYRALEKTNSHFKSQCCSKYTVITKPESNKGHNASINCSVKNTSKKKITHGSTIRKLNFERKMKTQNSSLSCSAHKNKVNLSASKEFLKHHSFFQSQFPLYNASRQLTKIKRPGTSHESTHKTIKVSSTVKGNSDLVNILNRTKYVLEGWKQERESWEKQKVQYQWKITELEGQIGKLKEKIRLGGKETRFHNILLC